MWICIDLKLHVNMYELHQFLSSTVRSNKVKWPILWCEIILKSWHSNHSDTVTMLKVFYCKFALEDDNETCKVPRR